MYQNVQEYEDNAILTADPIRLVQLLYQGALDAISAARRALAARDIACRSRHISKAGAILNELAITLDHSKAPELCRSLLELYDYMNRRLIDANVQQVEAPLIEVERLLTGLFQAWRQAGESQSATAAVTTGPGLDYGGLQASSTESVTCGWF